jgi:hypothetical protein
MLTNPLQRARSHAQMTGSGSGAAEFNPQHHSIRQREKSGLVGGLGALNVKKPENFQLAHTQPLRR